MSRARSLLAVVLAVLIPAAAIVSRHALASRVPLVRPCCCGSASSGRAPQDQQARLERSSSCAFSRCCVGEAPQPRLEVAEAHARPELTPMVAAAPLLLVDTVPAAPPRIAPLRRALAPPRHGPSLILQKHAFLL